MAGLFAVRRKTSGWNAALGGGRRTGGSARFLIAILAVLLSAGAAVADAALETVAAHDALEAAWTPVGPGVHYAVVAWSAEDAAQTVHVLRVERGQRYVRLAASLGRGQVEGTESVLTQALRLNAAGLPGNSGALAMGAPLAGSAASAGGGGPAAVVGGVNADFFASSPTPGLPIGLHVQGGEVVVSPAGRPVFAVLRDGRPVIGVPQLAGAVWREQPSGAAFGAPSGAATGAAGDGGGGLAAAGGFDDLLVRASITEVNRPPNGLGLVLYTPRFGTETPPLQGTVVTLRGVIGPLESGRVYSGVVARKEEGRVGAPVRAAIPADGVVLAGRGPAEVLLEDLSLGEWLQFQVELLPPFDQTAEAVAGWPVLIENGVVQPLNGSDTLVAGRHPRTALGFNDEYLFLVAADGRQPGYADGMTLAELAEFMAALGATEAVNLDGGGSTTMVLRPPGEERPVVVNRPSDGHERVVANALFVVSTAPPGPLATLHVRPAAPAVLAGATLPLQVLGLDVHNNPVAVEPAAVTWTVGGDEHAAGAALFGLPATEPGILTVTARAGAAAATVPIEVVAPEAIARIELIPDMLHLAAGESASFDVRAFDAAGRPVWVEPRQLTWTVKGGLCGPSGSAAFLGLSCGPGTAAVDPAGRVSGLGPGEAVVEARLGAAAATAVVTVDRPPVLLSDFETPGEWYANSVRAHAALSFVGPPDHVRSGRLAAKLVYDLSVSPGGTAAAYVTAATPIPIPDRPRGIGVWVYGDASGHWLRANYIDGDGHRQVMDLTPVGGLNWVGWRFVQGEIPADAVLPLRFERVYVVEMHRERQSRGVLYFDDLVALYGQP